MSFLRKVRNSISRGNSSTREKTPSSCRSSSIESKRRDSIESKQDGLQRSETFTIDDDETILTKVKPSKKQKVLSKFGTFTKRIKSPVHNEPVDVEQVHHNTYYSWRSGIVTDPAEAALDPFNSLYEQPSSLTSELSGQFSLERSNYRRGPPENAIQKPASEDRFENKTAPSTKSSDNGSRKQTPVDCSTYRMSRVPTHLREQLEQLKNSPEITEEIENDPEKFRTITINSFRRSFRERFLAKQNEVPYNPAWFVEVDPELEGSRGADRGKDYDTQSGAYVYENDNYRPTSRSPVRHRTPLQNISPVRNRSPTFHEPPVHRQSMSPLRATARSSVKRTETFKVERPSTEPSIRIEIKNSISPNQPGRIVPVGVAKPMPSQAIQQTVRNSRFESATRGWSQQPARDHGKTGRYQTCIHITSNDPVINREEPTRIRISGNERSPLRNVAPRKTDLPATKKQIYFGDAVPRDMLASAKQRQYNQHLDVHSYSRPSRPTSGFINRNDASRFSVVTQAVPRRSRSPIKVPWR